MKLEEEIYNAILQKIDFEDLAKTLSTKILADEKFIDDFKTKLFSDTFQSNRMGYVCVPELVATKTSDAITKIIIQEHAQNIMAKVSIEAIANTVMFKAATEIRR